MIRSNEDLFSTIDRLTILLTDCGEHAAAARLKDALSISNMPGEIIGEMRLALENIRIAPKEICPDIIVHIDESLKYINDIWK